MDCLRNSCVVTATSFNRAVAGFTSTFAITIIVLTIIGLSSPFLRHFNAISQLNTMYGVFLSTSIFVFILELVWIAALCKRPKKDSIPQLGPSLTRVALGNEKINKMDYFREQPDEIILEIFSYLNITELAKCGNVSKRWLRLAFNDRLWDAFDLRTISPLITVFDKSDWETYADVSDFELDTRELHPLKNSTVIPALMRCLSLSVEDNEGITLLTIPKGLTFNKLLALAGSPKMGNITKTRIIWYRDYYYEIGDIPIDRTYKIVITNNILNKSRKLSASAQKSLLNKLGCRMPTPLEAALLLIVTFMTSGKRFLCEPCTVTRCADQINISPLIASSSFVDKLRLNHLAVGSFMPEGFSADFDRGFHKDFIGVAAVVPFDGIKYAFHS